MSKREKAVVRAAMRLYRIWGKPCLNADIRKMFPLWKALTQNWKACAALAKTKRRKP